MEKGGHVFVFEGAAQRILALALLAGIVSHNCGKLAQYAFLLRHLAVDKPGSPLSPDLAGIFPCVLDEPEDGKSGKAWRAWYASLVGIIKPKFDVLLDNFGCESDGDTLRNACQIIYSIGSLVGEPSGQDA